MCIILAECIKHASRSFQNLFYFSIFSSFLNILLISNYFAIIIICLGIWCAGLVPTIPKMWSHLPHSYGILIWAYTCESNLSKVYQYNLSMFVLIFQGDPLWDPKHKVLKTSYIGSKRIIRSGFVLLPRASLFMFFYN
jgi:hypothetical protein